MSKLELKFPALDNKKDSPVPSLTEAISKRKMYAEYHLKIQAVRVDYIRVSEKIQQDFNHLEIFCNNLNKIRKISRLPNGIFGYTLGK